MIEYGDEDFLMLSGIQHIAFCERQWALIHIEQQWDENVRTVEGHHFHEKVDDPFFTETRKDIVRFRSVQLASKKLGLFGRADVIEWQQVIENDKTTIELPGRAGKWKPVPIEYKKGKPKPDERDEVQLCAQAICLEEAHNIAVEKGALYYGETRHRHEIIFTGELRAKVTGYAKRMHKLFTQNITPPPVYKSHCRACSLYNICLPKSIAKGQSVNEYLNSML